MSLTDAYLFESYRPSAEVWLCTRGDRLKGSGSKDDPFSANTRFGPALNPTSISGGGGADPKEATVTLAGHPYANGDEVEISGASGADGAFYNGRFLIYGKTTDTFNYRMKHPGPGANASGTFASRKVLEYLFDTLMDSFPAGTVIHLAPGIFETKGRSSAAEGWHVKSGQRILGSGIEATTIKLCGASAVDTLYAAIGWNFAFFLDGFEASDFTVDCNLPNQPIPQGYDFAPVACIAIAVNGRRIRLRRIRAVQFGTQTPDHECFTIVAAAAHPALEESVDCVIEDCIAERPSPNNVRETTVLHLGSGEEPNSGVMAYHRNCVIRNSVVDCDYADRPVPISGISISGAVATVTTKVPHGRSNGEYVVVTGAVENGNDNTTYNGSYVIGNVDPYTFTYTPDSPSPTAAPVGDMFIGKMSSHYVPLQSLSLDAGTLMVTLQTMTPHNRVLGNNVSVQGVRVNNSFDNAFNGPFTITDIVSSRTLKYKMTINPGMPDYTHAVIGNDFHGLSADGGIGTVVQGNRIYNCRIGGPYHDSFSTKDLLVFNNLFRGVVAGVFQNMGSRSRDSALNFRQGVSITYGGPDNKSATFTTLSPHGFEPGQAVEILGASPSAYNGIFQVDTVPSSTIFTYRMSSDPGANATGTFTYAAIWQVGKLVIENNTIELVRNIQPSGFGAPHGVLCYRAEETGSQYLTRQIIVRGNVIRHVNNQSDPSLLPIAISLSSCENAIVENNVVNLDKLFPLVHSLSGKVKYLNNQKPNGQLIEGYNLTSGLVINDLASDVELALLLAT